KNQSQPVPRKNLHDRHKSRAYCSTWPAFALRAASSALYSSSVKSYQPIQEKPISSMVRPVPAPTQFFGSGLNLLLVVLSHQLMTCSSVPAGTIGATAGS